VQRIRIERKAPVRDHRDRFADLPLDLRDPDILRAKAAPPSRFKRPRRIRERGAVALTTSQA